MRTMPLSKLLSSSGTPTAVSTHYSKATIAERFANRGIKTRAELATGTVPVSNSLMASMTSPKDNLAPLVARNDSKGSKSLMTGSNLNQKSQISEAFNTAMVKDSLS